MKNKKYVIISIIIIIVFLIFTMIMILINNKNNFKDTNDVNNDESVPKTLTIESDEVERNKKAISDNLLKERTLNNIKLKDIDILAINNTTTFKATIENISGNSYKNKELTLIFITDDGMECGRIEWPVALIKPNESSKIDICLTKDISNATDIIIEEK